MPSLADIASRLLADMGKKYPHVWRVADDLRARRGESLPDWDAWCFLPVIGWHTAMGGGLDAKTLSDMALLSAVGTWRPTQGIYRVEPELYAALTSTPLDAPLPLDVLFRLPEWCVLVELQEPGFCGVFAHLEYASTPELRLVFLLESGEAEPVIMELKDGCTLKEAMDKALSSIASQSAAIFGVRALTSALAGELQQIQGAYAERQVLVEKALSLILYLCSREPDIRDSDGIAPSGLYPAPQKTKKGWRIFPPDKPRVWHVGEEISRQLREAPAAQTTRAGGGHASPSPHIRRAHWHGFWLGAKKREGEEAPARRFELRWLPPIAVAMREDEDLPEA